LLLERYAHKIIIELSGHEHTADLRYHQGSALFNATTGESLIGTVLDKHTTNDIRHKIDYSKEKLNYKAPTAYHNFIINPGVTSVDGVNPGYTLLRLDLQKQVAYDL
jgi:hypothetical protein